MDAPGGAAQRGYLVREPQASRGGYRSAPCAGRLTLLGFFFLAVGDGCQLVLKPSAMRLVALLALQGPMQRSVTAEVLWPEFPEGRGRANLRNALWRLRQAGPLLVVEEGETLRLGEVEVDVDAVRTWSAAALSGLDVGPVPPRFDAEILPGWGDEWLVMTREELRVLQLYALEAAAQRLLADGRLGEAAALARTAVRM